MMNAYQYPVKKRARPSKSTEGRVTLPRAGLSMTELGELGSNLELSCYKALLSLGWKADDLQLQTSYFGGRRIHGGSVVDIIVVPIYTAISLKGEYWHQDPDEELLEDARMMQTFRRYVVIWDYETPSFEAMKSVVLTRIGRAI